MAVKMKPMLRGVNEILFGGDYNPEQWPEETWAQDMLLFHKAHVNTLTLNVFSWASLQPTEDTYDFTKLDRIMMLARDNKMHVILATSTAAQPAWMVKKYPETTVVDSQGRRHKFGGRQNICPNSAVFRRFSVELCRHLAQRYKDFDNIVAWHISNEYGNYCYCETCAEQFRLWLKRKYKTLDNLNKAWDTAFWSHTFYDWDEIVPASLLSEEWVDPDGRERSSYQSISLDYRRFMSESIYECYRAEAVALKEATPDIPVTTNLMHHFKGLDYAKWAKGMDFISWDCYPGPGMPMADNAFWHDVMRGIGGQRPFCLMEQSPNAVNWQDINPLKRPGQMRALSYQAMAHGADTVLYFQMRRSIAESEKYHSALIEHSGRSDTRTFREMEALGKELKELSRCKPGENVPAFLTGTTPSKAAIVFDWESWWAAELSSGPSKRIHYTDEVHAWYRTFYDHNIPVDIVNPDDDLKGYRLVIAPLLYISHDGFDEKVRTFVKNGGRFVTTYFSGWVDENDNVILGGYPGRWQDFLGLWVEEIDALLPESTQSFTYEGKQYPCDIACDILHADGEKAKVLATYDSDFYKGCPTLVENSFGEGKAYYMATRSNREFYATFLLKLTHELGIESLAVSDPDVEVNLRENENGSFYFVVNNNNHGASVFLKEGGKDLLTGEEIGAGKRALSPYEVLLIQKA